MRRSKVRYTETLKFCFSTLQLTIIRRVIGQARRKKKRTLSNDNPGVNHLAPYDSDFIFIMFFNSSAHEDS